jgi:hypothetical protein
MRRHARSVGAAAFLLVAASACSSGGKTAASATPTSRTTVAESTTTQPTVPPTTLPPLSTIGALPDELHATFAVVLATSDVRRGDEAGFWYLTLTPDNGYAFGRAPSDPGQNTGVLTVSAGTVTFSAERGEGPCDGAGTYRWTKTGDTLSFSAVDDSCSVRLAQTTAKPYRRCSGGPDTCTEPT